MPQYTAFGLVVVFTLLLYMLDISYWTGACGRLMRRFALAALAITMATFGLACFVKIPYMPLAIFILVLPVGALALRWSIMRESSAYNVARVFGALTRSDPLPPFIVALHRRPRIQLRPAPLPAQAGAFCFRRSLR